MIRIALTGGIAAGKSTVAHLFAQKNIPIVDTDVLAREVVQPGSKLLAEIAQQFGSDLIDPHGQLDRAQLRTLIFQFPEKRKALEALLHPAIWHLATQKISVLESSSNAAPYLILVVPLLVETASPDRADSILTVETDLPLQLQRLMARDAISEPEAQAMLAAQASSEQRISIANNVIHNQGNLGELQQQVDQLHEQFLHLASIPPTRQTRS